MKLLTLTVAMLITGVAWAGSIEVANTPLGVSLPTHGNMVASDKATLVMDGLYHVPGYLPGYPTAAVIWPRAVEVDCKLVKGLQTCDGFNWLPDMGRGEYLFIKPKVAVAQPEKIREVTIYKEVPLKKGKE